MNVLPDPSQDNDDTDEPTIHFIIHSPKTTKMTRGTHSHEWKPLPCIYLQLLQSQKEITTAAPEAKSEAKI